MLVVGGAVVMDEGMEDGGREEESEGKGDKPG